MLAQQIREHKALDAILGKAKVTEVSVDEFKEKMGADAGGVGDSAPKPATKKKTKKKVSKKKTTSKKA